MTTELINLDKHKKNRRQKELFFSTPRDWNLFFFFQGKNIALQKKIKIKSVGVEISRRSQSSHMNLKECQSDETLDFRHFFLTQNFDPNLNPFREWSFFFSSALPFDQITFWGRRFRERKSGKNGAFFALCPKMGEGNRPKFSEEKFKVCVFVVVSCLESSDVFYE